MLKVWPGWSRSYCVYCRHKSILPTLVPMKASHLLRKEDLVGWSDLWVPPEESSSLLLAPCLEEKQALTIPSRTLHLSFVTPSPEKRERACTLYASPTPYHCCQGVKACGTGRGGPGSSTLAKGSLTLSQGNLVKGYTDVPVITSGGHRKLIKITSS